MIPVVIPYILILSHKNVSQWQKPYCDITIANQSGHPLTRPNFSMTLSLLMWELRESFQHAA